MSYVPYHFLSFSVILVGDLAALSNSFFPTSDLIFLNEMNIAIQNQVLHKFKWEESSH